MSNAEVVAKVASLRSRLRQMGHAYSPCDVQPVDSIAKVYLGCDIVEIPQLSDRFAQQYLADRFGVKTSPYVGDDAPIAGGLYVSRDGIYRWIFVEKTDPLERRRFTIAHEIGHLWLEVEERFGRRDRSDKSMSQLQPILQISSCDQKRPRGFGRNHVYPIEQVREYRANAFAAELLMPIEGISPLRPSLCTETALDVLASDLARAYVVSNRAARIRLGDAFGAASQ